MPRYLPVVLLLGFAALACKPEAPPVPPAEPASSAPAAAVTILSPRSGDTTDASLTVRLAVAGAKVVPADGSHTEGEGHHHVFVDADPTPADSVIPKLEGIYHIGTGADSLRLEGLASGPHRLIAVFAYGDHVPMTSVKPDTVNFVVR
jgi:Domain of unknown function (DUF4399)